MSAESDQDISVKILRQLFAVTGKRYSEKLIDYGTRPNDARPLEKYDGYAKVVSGEECGDSVEVWLKVKDGRIEDATFRTTGCLPTYASAAAAAAMARGRALRDCLKINQTAIIEELGGMPEQDRHCALFAARTFQKALRSYLTGRSKKSDVDEVGS